MIARVSLEIALRKEFDYVIPPELADRVDVGSRVQVPFGPRKVLGVVTAVAEESAHARLKPILKIIGAQTLVTPRVLKLAVVLTLMALMPLRAIAGVTIGFCASGHQDVAVTAQATGHAHDAEQRAHHGHGEEAPAQPVDSSCNICAEHCSSAAFAPAMDAVLAAQPVARESIQAVTPGRAVFFPDQLDRPPLA